MPSAVLGTLETLARDGYPHEVCGLLVGLADRESTRVVRVNSGRNLVTDRKADRYLLDPDDFLRADVEARQSGLDIVGIWHTHPDHPARPSRTDLEAAWNDYSYLILSVRREGVADIKAWRLDGKRFVEQPWEESN